VGLTPLLTFSSDDVPPLPGAYTFEIEVDGRVRPAFAVRLRGGAVRAYLNDCPHFRVTLDLGTGEFFTGDRKRLLCQTHGAEFRVDDGFCETGPCASFSLVGLEVAELFGQVQVLGVASADG
jgi:nitrite reductase/ring-hydroxylating ferredoxin subunit